jgi:hypothetical protein
MSGSEVARLREQIERECEALSLLTRGFALTAPHRIISERYKQLDQSREHLSTLVGEEEATAITYTIYNQVVKE